MDVLKCLLQNRQEKSQQVQALLDCLADPSFSLQVCICSVGGVGSTELSNFLTRAEISCNLLTDQDAMRHVNRPPAHLGPETRLVYLFGDPLACVASHYRRKHAYHQALKTSGNPELVEATFPRSFEEYVAREDDLFGLQQHFDNWLNTPTQCDILFVRYENMFDVPVAKALFQYLCNNQAYPAAPKSDKDVDALAWAFASQKRSRASQVTPSQRQAMYVDLAAQMDALPVIFVRSKECKIKSLVPDGKSDDSS